MVIVFVNLTAVAAASVGSWGSRRVRQEAYGMRSWSRIEEGVGAGSGVEVFPDGVVVHRRRQRHKHVPDGVREGDDAVALEEEHAEAVDEPSAGHLEKTVGVALHKHRIKGHVTYSDPAIIQRSWIVFIWIMKHKHS